MTSERANPAPSHWRRRAKFVAIPQDQAVRQGNITRLAFIVLGKEAAIAFLNTECPDLGGRPLAVATASEAGETQVRAMLEKLVGTRANAALTDAGT
ncbi:DUF2384 domain-containing protein [Porphyrobacter algicida]|uniref:DUF2384 domain-containing protein n=1 Tax=Qipengyuania algicida TaxID=1836209 RepID=A0A845AMQ1_9SPHN|nr:antitoxin Xre/MbcA/ParS toxin-binding domain-containing protein [Qipengyuania algicida]MXP28278.1 DUF2384 domain-containing protein [Qipengyuania algicida]